MRLVIDIEGNSKTKPTKIWCIVCKDIDTGEYYVFRNVTEEQAAKKEWLEFASQDHYWIGHHLLGYDWPALVSLTNVHPSDISGNCLDTLVLSRLVDYPRKSHSIEDYGLEFKLEKGKCNDFTRFSQEMETYCKRDVDICHRIYGKYLRVINDNSWQRAISLEQNFQLIANSLHDSGFSFNTVGAQSLLETIQKNLARLDKEITRQFPAKLSLVKEIQPKVTKYGTLSKSDFRWIKTGDLSEFNGGPFCRCVWKSFNPSSHKQIVDILNSAGWQPTDRTATHIQALRVSKQAKKENKEENILDLSNVSSYNISKLEKYGWKINENNLSTLPDSAPAPAKSLAKRILLESRRRTLTEWLGLVSTDGRIHGQFQSIGAWTHRMAHQKPNTANIPTGKKLYGYEMRSLWQAGPGRLLVGVDAEGIQLRIFAHYIDDPEFTHELIKGDPHTLNKQILGSVCKNRDAAKKFIYALLLGAGMWKLSQILECSEPECRSAYNNLIERYSGFRLLKKEIIPKDAKSGYFLGLDGRKVRIPGENYSERSHLAMSGYLQNGEAIIIKKASTIWFPRLIEFNAKLVGLSHDEWQTETTEDREEAIRLAQIQADAIKQAGEIYGLKCPLSGSFWSKDTKDYSIGANWSLTH
jgi:DNA polymerase I